MAIGSATGALVPHGTWRRTRTDERASILVRLTVILMLSSTDSDLEAFSHNPTDGSFAPLAFQPSANASGLNLRFLSY